MNKIGIIDYCSFNGRAKGTIGSTFLRVDGLVANDTDFEIWTQGKKYDAVVLQKVYWLEYVKRFKGIKILDLADPDWQKPLERGGFDLINFSRYIDAITCSSERMTLAIRNYIKHIPVVYVPDRLNFQIFPDPKPLNDIVKEVCWFGYFQNAHPTLDDKIARLAENNIDLKVVSNGFYEAPLDYGNKITNIEYKTDTAYYEIQKSDMVLNPKNQTAAFKYKSDNKTVIGWKLGLPVAETLDDFTRLLDYNERQKEVQKRMDEVNKNYDIKLNGSQYKEIICNIQQKRNMK
jgi:hypothetical protein